MTLEHKVQLVENLFHQLEGESTQFRQASGINCLSGCGRCCAYPNITASPLEFLPWAFQLFLEGRAEEVLASLNESREVSCYIFTPLSMVGEGHCGSYKYRGLICRLFGFAASRDKYGNLRLATCKIIKEGQAKSYSDTCEAIANGLYIPVFTDYYMQLQQIDFQLGNKLLPINKALKMALEEVLLYFAYRPAPDAEKLCL